jgi:hypothetical protein
MTLRYDWHQSETTLVIRIESSYPNVEVFVSRCFIRISDPNSKKVLALDLLHDILYMNKHAPILSWGAKHLTIEMLKSNPGSWGSLVIQAACLPKPEIEARRNSSIEEAEKYNNEIASEATRNRRELKDRIGMKLLKQMESQAEAEDKRKGDLLKRVEGTVFGPITKQENSPKINSASTCSVRSNVERIIIVDCNSGRGSPMINCVD